MTLYGEVLFDTGDIWAQNLKFSTIAKIIKRPLCLPRFRVSILNPDETVSATIPATDIVRGGLNYTENYEQGQRKSLTLQLVNTTGRYTPSIHGIWLDTRFRLDMGIELEEGNIVWFPKGIYILGDVKGTVGNSDRTITLTLKDKFAMFEDKRGTLDEAYEIEVGSTIEDVIRGILNFSRGNGYVYDYKDIIYDGSFQGKVTQSTIRKEEGGNLGEIIKELATQLSAEYYYNNIGNLCFMPLNETVDDAAKPIIWTFSNLNRELHNIDLSYSNDNIINVVKVVGTNTDLGAYSAIVNNDNVASPICVERIGRRVTKKENSNIWSDDLAEELGRYYLRLESVLSVSFNIPSGFNPFLAVNNICEVENDFLNFEREKLLITSISINGEDGLTTLTVANTNDLPGTTRKRVI